MRREFKFYVYILKCSDDSFYVGLTNDLELRLAQHSSGINSESYTASRLPIEIKYYSEFRYIDQAIAFEKKIKGWSRKKKQALIEENWDEIVKLSACYHPYFKKKEY